MKCAIGLQVGIRTFTDTGHIAAGVFGLVGWEKPCDNPVTVRCQLSINGKPAPYFWLACSDPAHQKDAWIIENLKTGEKTRGVRLLEGTIQESTPALKPKKTRKRKTKTSIPRNKR